MIIFINYLLMIIILLGVIPTYFLVKGIIWLIKYINHKIKCPHVKVEVLTEDDLKELE